jgi:hypothetical protein
VRHGLGGDVAVRFLDGRFVVRGGAEADLEAPALAALRFGLTIADPQSCLALDVTGLLWLDEPIPTIAVALRL